MFAGRDSITAHFSCSGIERQFNVGRQLRRQPGLAMTGTDTQGRLQLDVAAIRKRIASVGSVYMSPGPHHTVTVQPGLGARSGGAILSDGSGGSGWRLAWESARGV